MNEHRENGKLWEKLTDEQKADLLIAEQESLNEENLVSHEEAKEIYVKLLKK